MRNRTFTIIGKPDLWSPLQQSRLLADVMLAGTRLPLPVKILIFTKTHNMQISYLKLSEWSFRGR